MEVNIRHKSTGRVLFSVTGTSLRGAKLFGLNLRDVDLRKADLCAARINANQVPMLLNALSIIIVEESKV